MINYAYVDLTYDGVMLPIGHDTEFDRAQISGRNTIKILPTRKQQTGDPEIIESSKILEFRDFENSRPMGFCSRETLQATE